MKKTAGKGKSTGRVKNLPAKALSAKSAAKVKGGGKSKQNKEAFEIKDFSFDVANKTTIG